MKRKFVSTTLFLFILLALAFSAWGSSPAQAATLTVQSGDDDGTANAANCPGVNCRLRDAIAAANPGDTITFADDFTIALVSALTIDKDLTIDGSGHSVALSGDTDGDTVADVQVMVINPGLTVYLNSLTIAKGTATTGGGIYNYYDSTLTITASTFSNNRADYGGGIFNDGGTLAVTGSYFSANSATLGGGILNNSSSLTVTDSTLSGNTASQDGGGIYNDSGTLTVTGCYFSGNTASHDGGGIENDHGTLNITDGYFSGNTATSGGGIWTFLGMVTVTDSTFSNNGADFGGGISNNASTGAELMTVINSTFSDNSATDTGGGINNFEGLVTVTNSTFTGNNATNGGGAYNYNGTLTVTSGTFSGNNATNGGGIFNYGGLSVTGTIFSGNSALVGGGGIENNSGTLTVTNGTFNSNNAHWGGGIEDTGGTITVSESTFSANIATYSGGGIQNDHSTLTMTGVTFSGNNAGNGGGIYNTFGTLTVTNSSFSDNTSTDGGGIYNNVGTLNVTGSTFYYNNATDTGGGILNWSALVVIGSTFSGNNADSYGGGIFSHTTSGTCANASAVTIANSTFSGNNAPTGGGIYNHNGVVTLLFNTITANTSGGGVRSYNDGQTCTKAGSNIIAGNTGYDLSAYATAQRFSSLDYNLVGVAGANVDFSQEFNQPHDQVNMPDPMLGALGDNGGPTETHALLPGSPALDAGDDAACAADPVNGLDQRGVARPQSAHCDIGAYEYANSAPTDISLSNNSVYENQTIDTFIGSFTTTDPDPGDNNFTYSFCGGSDDDFFIITGDELLTGGPFDYETRHTYNICVRTDDSHGGTFDKNFAITILDIPNVELVAPWNGEPAHTNRPTFQWNAYAGAANYLIQISTSSNFSSKVTKATLAASVTTYTPKKDLLRNTTYYWRVSARVGGIYIPWSETWSFTTGNPPPIPVLTSPGNKKTVAGPSPLFDWKDVKTIPGVAFLYYKIQISTNANFTTISGTGYSAESQYNGFSLPPGTYYWRVCSLATNGDFSAWSKVRIVTIQ